MKEIKKDAQPEPEETDSEVVVPDEEFVEITYDFPFVEEEGEDVEIDFDEEGDLDS